MGKLLYVSQNLAYSIFLHFQLFFQKQLLIKTKCIFSRSYFSGSSQIMNTLFSTLPAMVKVLGTFEYLQFLLFTCTSLLPGIGSINDITPFQKIYDFVQIQPDTKHHNSKKNLFNVEVFIRHLKFSHFSSILNVEDVK